LDIEKLKFPIGEFSPLETYTNEQIHLYIDDIEKLPLQLKKEVEGFTDNQLDTPYRPGGWTIRQVVHHIPDSHMNAHIRFKLTLTEENVEIRPYYEDRWAELSDYKMSPDVSLNLLEGIHKRWVNVLRSMNPEDFSKKYTHPEYKKVFQLKEALHMYSWHCRHHLAHITELKKRMNWK